MAQRITITFLLAVCYLFLPKYGFVSPGGSLWEHLLYPVCHANIFHLLCNLLCLWMLRCPLYLPLTIPIALICSFLPCISTEPTMGFSGVLFAIVGVSWGRSHKFLRMCKYNLPIILITLLIPNVNALIHLYCMMAGYLAGLVQPVDRLAKYDPYTI